MKRIRTLDQLMHARSQRKAVFCPTMLCFAHRCPAAFVANYTGETLHRMMKAGLYVYEPKQPTKEGESK